MTEHCYCGIDVAKERLDVQVLPHRQRFSVDNNATGGAELIARLHALPIAAVGIEPSGGYERGIIRALLAADLSVRRINPNKLRQFGRARGVLAKNDRLDAQLIAEYVSIMPTRIVQRAATAERLAEVVTMRRQLCDEHVTIENQAAHVEDAILRRLNKRRLARLKADIHLLDKRLAEIVAADAILTQRYELLTSMRGVGPTLAFTLIALLPELGQMSRKQIAALVGLAPYDFDNGRLKGHRCIYRGRMPVRNVLYMAALSAARYNPVLKVFHNRRAATNKKPKVIIVAVMRKMITTLKAMVRDNAAWQPRAA
jgi:transposase